jgi:hypothetical protein
MASNGKKIKHNCLEAQASINTTSTAQWIESGFSVPWFVSSYDHLEHPDTCTTLALPILWVRIETLQHIKGLGSIVKLTHLYK